MPEAYYRPSRESVLQKHLEEIAAVEMCFRGYDPTVDSSEEVTVEQHLRASREEAATRISELQAAYELKKPTPQTVRTALAQGTRVVGMASFETFGSGEQSSTVFVWYDSAHAANVIPSAYVVRGDEVIPLGEEDARMAESVIYVAVQDSESTEQSKLNTNCLLIDKGHVEVREEPEVIPVSIVLTPEAAAPAVRIETFSLYDAVKGVPPVDPAELPTWEAYYDIYNSLPPDGYSPEAEAEALTRDNKVRAVGSALARQMIGGRNDDYTFLPQSSRLNINVYDIYEHMQDTPVYIDDETYTFSIARLAGDRRVMKLSAYDELTDTERIHSLSIGAFVMVADETADRQVQDYQIQTYSVEGGTQDDLVASVQHAADVSEQEWQELWPKSEPEEEHTSGASTNKASLHPSYNALSDKHRLST